MNDANRAFYEEHYSGEGWDIAELQLTVLVPTLSRNDALELVREILTDAQFDIRVEERVVPVDRRNELGEALILSHKVFSDDAFDLADSLIEKGWIA